MRHARLLIALVALLPTASLAQAQAQARGGEWISYRDAYRAMLVFEKYGGPKNFIQNHLQVAPTERGGHDEMQLTLVGKSTRLDLPLDPTGRTVFPLLKAAYDENAALVLNPQAGQYAIRPRVSIVVRPDGVYEAADLRAACEQALAFARYADASVRSRQCGAVRFVFARKGSEALVHLRRPNLAELALPVVDGAAFAGERGEDFATVTYRFAAPTERAQLVTHTVPLAIAPLFD